MAKGDLTRQAILDHAFAVASVVGLEGLSIGRLAEDLNLSKSGLFAHFHSKEGLQLQVLDTAARRFVDEVVRPGLSAPRGEPRLRALFDGWLHWGAREDRPGGCFFVNVAFELDARPGPVRDRFVSIQQDWMDTLATAARSGVSVGQFRPDLDAEQFAFEIYGSMLGYHHASRLLRDPRADAKIHAAFERLLLTLRA